MHELHVMQGSSHNLWVIGKDLKLTRTGLLCTLKDENECNESLSENWKSFSSSVSPPCGGSKFVFVLRVSDSRYCGGLNWIGGGIISWPINKSKSNSEKHYLARVHIGHKYGGKRKYIQKYLHSFFCFPLGCFAYS